ncbi:hypothetical protein [Kribbella sp. NPDC023855]|uniref:hypothetical protein n=1 Tax=Kribbella sp. NPDC023855 TaxID=3154698 RepID=UPI0033EE64D6
MPSGQTVSPALPQRLSLRHRLAWILRVNRQLGSQPAFAVRTRFAEAWPSSTDPRSVNPSTIYRWEAGQSAIPHSTVRRYEHLLGLPAGHLVAVFDHALRTNKPVIEAPPALSREHRLDHRALDRRLDAHLDRACTSGLMSGSDWDELTDLLATRPTAYLPGRTWRELSHRLLAEMLLACGRSWLQRYEAVNRLLAHPAAQADLIDACAVAAADRDNQVMISTLAALGTSSHRDSISILLRQLVNPTDERALYGTVLALTEAATLNQLDPGQRRQAIRLLREIVAPGGPLGSMAHEALRMIGGPTRNTASTRYSAAEPVSLIAQRIAHTAAAALPNAPENFADPVLPQLVEELLFDPSDDARLMVSAMIAATPYRAGIAAALSAELKRGRTLTGDPERAGAFLSALRMLGGRPERGLIERIVVADGIPSPTISVAAFALGHFAETPPDSWWDRALGKHLADWQRTKSQTSVAALRGLAYSAGVNGNRGPLRRLRSDPDTPAAVRAGAAWWQSQPAHVIASAQL